MKNTRYFQIAGMTIQVKADLPFRQDTFHPKFETFATDAPGEDLIQIHHHFDLPDLADRPLGRELYRRPPWAIHGGPEGYTYVWTPSAHSINGRRRTAFFNKDHSVGEIYNDPIRRDAFLTGNVESLTFFPTDQILIAPLLADRQGCILHSCGAIIDGKGYLFVGHSDAGKSTMATTLKPYGTILCDDRNIVRNQDGEHILYGTWSHGDVPDVSADSAPLAAIYFLNQARENRIALTEPKSQVVANLLACLIKPLETAHWWERMLNQIHALVRQVPCYNLYFNKSGTVVKLLGFDR